MSRNIRFAFLGLALALVFGLVVLKQQNQALQEKTLQATQ